MTQRQPRLEDAAWLAHVRTLPCLICGKVPSDPAHIRSSSLRYGKRQTGLGEKPSDVWVLPLCRLHHDEQHRHGNELAWWAGYGIDPFAVALKLYGGRQARERTRRSKPTARKPRSERVPIKQRNDLPKRGEVKFRR
jgi:hypothetical protein